MRPDYCPASNYPCAAGCETPCTKPYDAKHRYVQTLKGCGHGVLYTDYCRDCEVVSVMERYRNAIRTVQSCRNEMRRLGINPPGEIAP